MRRLAETFKMTTLDSNRYNVGDIIIHRAGHQIRVVKIEENTITVSRLTERQETLARLTGRSPDEFIP